MVVCDGVDCLKNTCVSPVEEYQTQRHNTDLMVKYDWRHESSLNLGAQISPMRKELEALVWLHRIAQPACVAQPSNE